MEIYQDNIWMHSSPRLACPLDILSAEIPEDDGGQADDQCCYLDTQVEEQ